MRIMPWDSGREIPGYQYVGEIELSEVEWSFEILAVWVTREGYYLGTDSGCSCPTPFENYTAEDLTGPLTAEQAREEMTSLWAPNSVDPEDFGKLIERVV